MFDDYRVYLGWMVAVVGCCAGVYVAYKGSWLGGVNLSGAGILSGLRVAGIGTDDAFEMSSEGYPHFLGLYAAGWLAFVGAGFGALLQSPFLDHDRQNGLRVLSLALIELTQRPSNELPPEVQAVIDRGIFNCVLQPNIDAIATTESGINLLYQPAEASIVAGATGLGQPPSPLPCLDAYRKLRPLIPSAFQEAETQSPWLLKQLDAPPSERTP